MNDTTTIGFHPALPCSTVQGDGICGQPATAGTLYPTGGGQYLLQPFCRDCTAALMRVYGPDSSELFPPPPGPKLTIVGRRKRVSDDST